MSRDFDKAQEMVVASMEYVKVLGFRIRRTEVQRDDWKKVALFHADEVIKLRQRVDELKAERDALRSTTIDTAAGSLLDAFGSLANEPRHGATDAAYRDRIVTKIHTIKLERDALRADVNDLRTLCDQWKQRETELLAEIERLKKTARKHPVAVGEWVLRTGGGGAYPIGTVAQVNQYSPSGDYLVRLAGQTRIVTWFKENCTPCDPPEATHDTPAGKETAQAAAEPQPGDVVRLGAGK